MPSWHGRRSREGGGKRGRSGACEVVDAPFDESAVDAAIRLKETGIATEVVVLSIGVKPAQEALRNAPAMRADRAKTYAKGVVAEGVRQDGILTTAPEGAPEAPAAGEAPAEGGRRRGGFPAHRVARPDPTRPAPCGQSTSTDSARSHPRKPTFDRCCDKVSATMIPIAARSCLSHTAPVIDTNINRDG